MPFSLISLPPAVLAALLGGPHQEQVDDVLRVQWQHKHVQVSPAVITFDQGVKAFYGPTVVSADKLTLYLDSDARYGVAEGHVKIDDPVGTATADEITFNWMKHTGTGRNMMIQSGNVMLQAGSADIGATSWQLTNVYATPCGEDKPLLAVRAPRIVVNEDLSARMYRPTIEVFGKKLITLRKYDYSRGTKSVGIGIPSLSYSRSNGFALSEQLGFQLNEKTAFNAGLRVSARGKPSGDLLLTRSLLGGSEPATILPHSDFDERFNTSYFENIYVRSPEDERRFLSTKRLTVSVGAAVRESAVARKETTLFTKPIEAIVEEAGPIGGGLTQYGQLRLQRIAEEGKPYQNRAVGTLSLSLPSFRPTSWLSTDVRLDGMGFAGEGKLFTWAHAQAGVTLEPAKALRLGVAYSIGKEFGEPFYEADRLYATHSLNLRGDLLLGPTKLSALFKYDTQRKSFYDREFFLSQVAGCIEPFFAYRTFPRTSSFGVRVRLDALYDAIERRTQMAQAQRKRKKS